MLEAIIRSLMNPQAISQSLIIARLGLTRFVATVLGQPFSAPSLAAAMAPSDLETGIIIERRGGKEKVPHYLPSLLLLPSSNIPCSSGSLDNHVDGYGRHSCTAEGVVELPYHYVTLFILYVCNCIVLILDESKEGTRGPG
jgi:hypothetical protein